AVYASQCGLPTPRARLASGRWSGATGRAFHPQGSTERFQSSLHLIPLSQAACRNRIDRRALRGSTFGARCALTLVGVDSRTLGPTVRVVATSRAGRRYLEHGEASRASSLRLDTE